MTSYSKAEFALRSKKYTQRQGVIVVLTSFLLTVIFAFLVLSVDTGRVVLTETELQNGVDAAALAAAQEISAAVYAAGQGQGSANIDGNSVAVQAARTMAAQVAAANGVFIDPNEDVSFGARVYNPASGEWAIQWGTSPFSVVRVQAHRTNPDTSAVDGELPLTFGWAIGRDSVPLNASATAFIEARDMVLVLDWSASMNDDTSLGAINSLGQAQVEGSLDAMWNALQTADPKFPGTTESKWKAAFGNINSYEGTYLSSTTTSSIYNSLNLGATNPNGTAMYPFPQAGRYSNGDPKSKPSNSASQSLWYGYINYVKYLSGPYKKKYGFRTLMSYLQDQRFAREQSEDLWRTPHYPHHGVRGGASLFLAFLDDLGFGDEVGLVGYGQWAEQLLDFNDGEVSIDVSDDPITSDYSVIDTIQGRHQAGEYQGWTAMGDGILKARELLVGMANNPDDNGYSRYGTRPTMILMTDGQTNQRPYNWSLPGGFNWAEWTDYDGDGNANYSTTDKNKQYAFWQATEAIKCGTTIHTLSVGEGADVDLMKAIAFAGAGVAIIVPGGTSVSEMQADLEEAFSQIAAKVPAAQLIYELD
jgi:hypothetical protein